MDKKSRILFKKAFRKSNFLYIGISCLFLLSNLYICHQISAARSVWFIGCISIALLLILYIVSKVLLKNKKITVIHIFLGLLIFEGMLYLLIFLPITVPDELYHYLHTYNYSNLLLLLPIDSSQLFMRQSDVDFLDKFTNALSGSYYASTLNQLSVFAHDPSIVESSYSGSTDIGANPPQVRIPAAIGIALGRLLGFGAIEVFYLGRVFNFIYFVILIYFALRITPLGRQIFMAVCLLPMTLHVAASYSYDSAIIGLTFLYIALILKALYSKERLTTKLAIAILLMTFLIAPCKVIYTTVVFLVLFIPSYKFESHKKMLIYKVSALLVCLLSILLWRLPSLISISGIDNSTTTLNVRGTESGTYYDFFDILTDPFGFLSMIFRTINSMGDFYFNTMIGGSLGWFQTGIASPWYIVIAFFVLLLLAIPKALPCNGKPTTKERILFFALFSVVSFLVLLSLYTGWTFNTETVIQGVQGRYFLPVLPLALLAFQGNLLVARRSYSTSLLFAFSVLNVAYITRIYAMALAV